MVQLHNGHNHQTLSCHALSKREVSAETTKQLLKLFGDGYGPTAAVNVLKFDLHLTSTDAEYAVLSADRAVIPDFNFAVK